MDKPRPAVKLFNFRIVIIICICFNAVYGYSQTMSIKAFETLALDLTARTEAVEDANGVECALLKIVSPDIITKIEGNALKVTENGNEYRAYLSSGTKKVRIFTRRHKPLDLYFPDYLQQGVASQTTYILELNSDLPAEILYGTSNPFAPTKMAGKGDELLPVWWNASEDGLYVGISCPTFDGESAKQSALCNAINLYAQSTGAEVKYIARTEVTDESENYAQHYTLSLRDFDVSILQEYYNCNGEYFVLCKFNDVKDGSNTFQTDWLYDDDTNSGSVNYLSKFKGKINGSPVECNLAFTNQWSGSKIWFLAKLNEKTLLDREQEVSALHDNLTTMQLSGPLGLSQLRLISALPCLPDSVSINAMEEREIDSDKFLIVTNTQGVGNCTLRRYKLIDYKDNTCSFSIDEAFPEIKSSELSVSIDDSDKSGLSVKYFRDYGDMAISCFGRSLNPISLEHNKNNAFLNCLSAILHSLYQDSPYTGLSGNIAIHPLWYLDSYERKKYTVKRNKTDWETNQRSLESQVSAVVPDNR